MCFVNVSGLLSIQVAQAAEKTRRVLKNAMAQNSLWATDCRECLPLLHELPELHVRLLGRARVEPESSAVGEHSFLLLQEFVVAHLRDGVGLIVAMTVLAAVGDITRFPTSKKLVGYSGLAAGVHDSGQTHRTRHITKEGRKELRYVLVEAAWHVVETNDFWKAEFERLCRRMEKNLGMQLVPAPA